MGLERDFRLTAVPRSGLVPLESGLGAGGAEAQLGSHACHPGVMCPSAQDGMDWAQEGKLS